MAKNTKIDFAVGIGGENGQGIASTGDILARIFARRGLHLNAYNAYQSIIRGGHTFLTIRASDAPVTNMGDKIDVFIPLNQDTMDRHLRLLKAGACCHLRQRKSHARSGGRRRAALPDADEGPDQRQQARGQHRRTRGRAPVARDRIGTARIGRRPAIQEEGRRGRGRKHRRRPGRLRICGAEFQTVPVEGAGRARSR